MSLRALIGPLDRSVPSPLYCQLRQSLRDAIDRDVLQPDHALPAERDIATDFGVSRITIRRAIDGLVEEGLLNRRHGAGTFVASRIEKNFTALSSFSEDIASRGWTSRSEWIGRKECSVTAAEALKFGLPPGLAIYRLDRIRFAGDLPLAVEHAIVPASSLSSIDAVEDSLYTALEKSGHRPRRALQRLQAVALDDRQAELLGVNPGEPALAIERRGFLADGRVVEVTQSCYRGDAYDFVAELTT